MHPVRVKPLKAVLRRLLNRRLAVRGHLVTKLLSNHLLDLEAEVLKLVPRLDLLLLRVVLRLVSFSLSDSLFDPLAQAPLSFVVVILLFFSSPCPRQTRSGSRSRQCQT